MQTKEEGSKNILSIFREIRENADTVTVTGDAMCRELEKNAYEEGYQENSCLRNSN